VKESDLRFVSSLPLQTSSSKQVVREPAYPPATIGRFWEAPGEDQAAGVTVKLARAVRLAGVSRSNKCPYSWSEST
jgi:hypothetical protein